MTADQSSPVRVDATVRGMDEQLVALAATQDGVFTTAQARRCGIGETMLAHLRRKGSVVSLGRSAYAVAAQVPGDPAGQHLQKARAALLIYPDAHLCGVSSLVAAGIAVWDVPLNRVELSRPVTREVLTQMCRIRPPDPFVRPPGGDNIAAGVVQLALDQGPMFGVVAGDSALHEGRTTLGELSYIVDRLQGWPHSGRARAMLAHVDARSESVGESRLRVILAMSGIPVVPQVELTGAQGFVARVDLLVEGTNVVVEFDGRVKYADGDPDVLWAEKRREDAIRSLGYVVVRVVWADLYDPARLLRRVRSAIAQASPRKTLLHPRSLVG